MQVFAPHILLQTPPNTVEDELRVLDLEIGSVVGGGRWMSGTHGSDIRYPTPDAVQNSALLYPSGGRDGRTLPDSRLIQPDSWPIQQDSRALRQGSRPRQTGSLRCGEESWLAGEEIPGWQQVSRASG